MNNIDHKYSYLVKYFSEHNPNAASELHFESTFQLLVAVVLSAQCTDKRVNIVTQELFALYPTAKKMSQASVTEILELIKSVSYPNNKASHLYGLSHMLMTDFGGEVPDNMEDLQKLPGVGRKTANVILSVAFQQPTMAVDTHVFRVATRIGLIHNAKTPLEAEKQLVAHLPQEVIAIAHHWLILHGRYVCIARKPQCETCGIKTICDYYLNQEKKLLQK